MYWLFLLQLLKHNFVPKDHAIMTDLLNLTTDAIAEHRFRAHAHGESRANGNAVRKGGIIAGQQGVQGFDKCDVAGFIGKVSADAFRGGFVGMLASFEGGAGAAEDMLQAFAAVDAPGQLYRVVVRR